MDLLFDSKLEWTKYSIGVWSACTSILENSAHGKVVASIWGIEVANFHLLDLLRGFQSEVQAISK